MDDGYTQMFNNINTSLSIDAAGVHIRKSINGDLGQYEVFIDESSFRIRSVTSGSPPSDPATDTAAVMWIDEDNIHIYNADVVNALDLGQFRFEPRTTGNLSLYWTGV
jgi:hypothetical protein